MNPIAITLLILAAFAGFIYFTVRKLRIVASLQPDLRWDDPWGRVKNLLVYGFLQSRMIGGERKAGIMHTVFFLGFLFLLLRKLQLLVIGYDQWFVYPGLAGEVFSALKDFVEILIVLALCYGFYRRLVLKPRRLEPGWNAYVILTLIMIIMVTDFLYEGFLFALYSGANTGIANERAFAFVGSLVATGLSGLPPATLEFGFQATYWVQIVTVLCFLVWLPVDKHFHIVTALPTVFFGRWTPPNKVPTVDLEAIMDDSGDAEIKIGVGTAKDLTWKEGLDAFTCTECGRCKDSCPTFLSDKPLALKWVNDSLKRHLFDKRAVLVKNQIGEEELPPLVGDIIAPDTLWACTTCGYCEWACPIRLEHLGKFYRMRQHKVMMDGEFPSELKGVFDRYESTSNPWGLPADTRGDWAKGLGVQIVETPEQVQGLDYLFYVGSALSFDNRGQKIARAFVKVLQAADVKFAILGASETSTGECVRRVGNEMVFQQLAQSLIGTLNELQVTRIVTCDPHALNALKNEFPDFGGRYEVIHHTQLIDRLLQEGRIKVGRNFERVVYHDSCYLGRHNGEYEAPRRVIARLSTDVPLEFDLQRSKSMCCGAGGGRMWMEESIGKRINVTRVGQVLPKNPSTIATACPYCNTMMTDGVAHHGKDGEIKIRDIAELVADALNN